MPIGGGGNTGGASSTEMLELLGQDLVFANGSATAVIVNTETLLATTTVASGKTLRIKGVSTTGTGCAVFTVYVNSVLKHEGRIVWTERNINHKIEVDALSGETVELKVEHEDVGKTYDFFGSIYGYELTN